MAMKPRPFIVSAERMENPKPPAPHCWAIAKYHRAVCCMGTCGEFATHHCWWGSGCGHTCPRHTKAVKRSAERQQRHIEITELTGQVALPFGNGAGV